MPKTVTTRLDDEYVNQIDEMAARRGIDRSALMRLFLVNSLKKQTIQDSLDDYKTGTITLWEAALRCKLTLWEMVKEVQKAHIYTNYNLDDLKRDLKSLHG